MQMLLAPYLEAFGHRASDWEYVDATLAERPERAVQLLRDAVARILAGQMSAVSAVTHRRDEQIAGMRARLSDAAARVTFDRLLRDAQETFAIHEVIITLYMLLSA